MVSDPAIKNVFTSSINYLVSEYIFSFFYDELCRYSINSYMIVLEFFSSLDSEISLSFLSTKSFKIESTNFNKSWYSRSFYLKRKLKNFFPNKISKGSLRAKVPRSDSLTINYVIVYPLTSSFKAYMPKKPEITTSEVNLTINSYILTLNYPLFLWSGC